MEEKEKLFRQIGALLNPVSLCERENAPSIFTDEDIQRLKRLPMDLIRKIDEATLAKHEASVKLISLTGGITHY